MTWSDILGAATIDDQLAAVLAGVEHRDRCRCRLDALLHVLAVAKLAGTDPASQRSNGLFVPRGKIGGEEALHDRALHEQMPFRPRPLIPRIPACVVRSPADRNARSDIDVPDNGIVNRTGCIVEERIDATGAKARKRSVQIRHAALVLRDFRKVRRVAL